ncbi:MAG: hypothetical protein ABSG93_18930 [Solirubrobacteraceae bacterium]|jgi:chromosome segregation ATPase
MSSQDLGLKPFASDAERREAYRRRRGKGEATEVELLEQELIREIEQEDRRIEQERERLAGLPPESSGERENRELRERLGRLEAERDRRTYEVPPQMWGETTQERQQRNRREALRLLRNRRQAQAEHDALMAHRGAVRGEIRRLENAIEATDRELAALEQRHAAERDRIAGERRELNDALGRLMAPLGEGETSKSRVAEVLAVTA